MAKSLRDWLSDDVEAVRHRPLRWLSEFYFFRDPVRPIFSDSNYFFAPADGIILYQRTVDARQPLVEIKGRPYTLRDAMRIPVDTPCLVIGIFMTLYDVHVNRIPYSGTLSFRLLPPIATYNRPMLKIENALLSRHSADLDDADYLFANERMLNTIHAPTLGLTYYVLQIADYDVASILPFEQRQNHKCFQNERFSQVRFGSQVDLVIPLSDRIGLATLLPDLSHVEAGIDPIVKISKPRMQ